MDYFLDKNKKYIYGTIIGLLIISLINLASSDTEFGLTEFILKHLLLPIFLLAILTNILLHYLDRDTREIMKGNEKASNRRLRLFGQLLITTPGMALYFFLVFQGLLGLTNKNIGHQDIKTISGKIIDKDLNRTGATTRYYLEIFVAELKRSIEIRVSQDDYEKYELGENYAGQINVGSLGFVYKKKEQ